MKKNRIYLLFCLLSMQSFFWIVAQDSLSQPYDLGTKSNSFSFSDTKNTNDYSNAHTLRSPKDVFYKFRIETSMTVIVSHCGSILGDTYVHVLDSIGNRIYFNDDYSGVGKCSNAYHSYIKVENLSPGMYYVVSEGYNQNGVITTTIEGICPLPPAGIYDGNAAMSPLNLNQNFILSITPNVATSDASGLSASESLQKIQYFDGLGRPIQTVQRGITPNFQDLVTYNEYDGFGRESISWLPISTSGNGAFTPLTDFVAGSSLYAGDNRPYSETIYDNSPLNRVAKKKGPGADWASKSATVTYDSDNGTIAYFFVNNAGNLVRGGNYASNTIHKTTSKDEDEISVTEFQNLQGQVVLKRNADNVDTYYVYNELGQLYFVLPPLAADVLKNNATNVAISDDNVSLKKYGYLYKYDDRGNCIAKRLPGCGWIYMVYDKANRLLLSQDGNQRENPVNRWTINKYDSFGRLIYTAEMIGALGSYTELNNYFKDHVVTEEFSTGVLTNPMHDTGYSKNTYNSQETNLLTVNYYDNYNFLDKLPTTVKANLQFQNTSPYDNQHSSAKGLLTGTRTYLLDGSGQYTVTAMYYDYRGQVVQTRSTNHLGGYDYTYNKYNFNGQVTQSLKTHSIPSQTPVSELYEHEYDHAGRLLSTQYKINDKPQVLLVDNTATDAYDELGRLRNKKRHNGTDAEEIDYNIRNQPTRIKSGTFEQQLFYNTGLPNGGEACYNGNIAYSTWTYNGTNKGYLYYYDNQNRLEHAYTSANGVVNYAYNEAFTYDKMGNILYLDRQSANTSIDFLTYTYNGNQVISISDDYGSLYDYNTKEYQDESYANQNEMAYDSVGNLTKDLDRNIVTIKYNLLNLPDTIQFRNGNQIVNKYDAGGRKLSTLYYTLQYSLQVPLTEGEVLQLYYDMDIVDETGTFYVDNIEYDFNGCDPGWFLLRNVYNTEGYANKFNVTGGPFYQYYRKDHLGNNREVWCANNATILQRTHYYPSGLPWHTNTSVGAGVQDRKYNGKEFVEMHGLDEYDSEARWYYPAIMRTTTMDPLAEKYYDISPYAWCGNNPVKYVDLDGRAISTAIGTVIGTIGGGVNAAIKGTDVWAGMAEGAVAGFIAGAAVDITIATCGLGGVALVGAATAAGTLGGAAGGVLGDVSNQVVTQVNKNVSFADISITPENFGSKALFGAVSGAAGGLGSGVVGVLGNFAKNSTQALQTTMIQGVAANTTEAAASAVTKGAVKAATNTGVSMLKLDATVSTITSTASTVVGASSRNQSSNNSQSTKSNNSQNSNSNNSVKPVGRLF